VRSFTIYLKIMNPLYSFSFAISRWRDPSLNATIAVDSIFKNSENDCKLVANSLADFIAAKINI